jgi:hypothetical protein
MLRSAGREPRSKADKSFRSSLSHGTPPLISDNQHDIPHPVGKDSNYNEEHADADSTTQMIFCALVGLTLILGEFLRHIYDLKKQTPRGQTQGLQHLESRFSVWKTSLQGAARTIVLYGAEPDIPGAANFRLAYLAVEMLLHRIQLDTDKQVNNTGCHSTLSQRYVLLQRIAEDVVRLVQGLPESQLRGFWLPTSATIINSAISYLLRIAVGRNHHNEHSAQESALKLATDLMNALRLHKDRHQWDIGDNCIEQYGQLVDALCESRGANRVVEENDIPRADVPLTDIENFMMDSFETDPYQSGPLFFDTWTNL